MSVFAEEEKKTEKNVKPAVRMQETVQRDLSDVNGPEGGMLPDSVSARIQSLRGSGQRLSDRQISDYSQKFGRDMSDVHIHNDTEADNISRALNARAFTIGSDVFLTKGINPDGGGRDAETLTHELTHVVQQNGQAGYGQLRLGAADTAQEHEAEAAARREFSPELSAEDTVQRGFGDFVGDFFGGIGDDILKGFGKDTYDALFGGSDKVKAAIAKMEPADKQAFEEREKAIADMEGSGPESLKTLQKTVNEKKTAIAENERAKRGEAYNNSHGQPAPGANQNSAAALGEDAEKQLNEAIEAYDNKYDEYQTACDAQLAALTKIDDTITESDVSMYRSGRAKRFFGLIGANLSSFVLSIFSASNENAQKQQEKGRNLVTKSIISGTFGSERKKKAEFEKIDTSGRIGKRYVRNTGDAFEAVSLDEQSKILVSAAYDDLMKEEEMKEWLKTGQLGNTKDEIVDEVVGSAAFAGVKKSVGQKMMKMLIDTSQNLKDANDRKNAIKALRDQFPDAFDHYNGDKDLHTELEQINASIQQKQTEIDAQQAIINDQTKSQQERDAATQEKQRLDTEKGTLEQNKADFERDNQAALDRYNTLATAGKIAEVEEAITHITTDYKDQKPLDVYISDEENRLLADPRNMTGMVDQKEFAELQGEIRMVVDQKLSEKRTTADRTRATAESDKAQRFTQTQPSIIDAAAEKLNGMDEIKQNAMYQNGQNQLPDDQRKEKIKAGLKDAEGMKAFWNEVKIVTDDHVPDAGSEIPALVEKAVREFRVFLYDVSKNEDSYTKAGTKWENIQKMIFTKLPSELRGPGKTYPKEDTFQFEDLFKVNSICGADKTRISAMITNRVPFNAESEAEMIANKIADDYRSKKSDSVASKIGQNIERKKKEKLIRDTWEKVQADEDLKKHFKTWLLFRKTVMSQFEDMINEAIEGGEQESDIVDAIIEGMTVLASEKEEKK